MAFLTFAEAKVVAPPIVPKNNKNENETTKCVQI